MPAMHELAIAQDVVQTVVAETGGARVLRVVMVIGKLSAVLPDAVRFCFGFCAEGGPLEGASLEIIEPPGRARCRTCGHEFELERPFGRCPCGNTDLDWLSGEELEIRHVEVA